MELQRQGANVAVILFNDGARILFSYDVPVAAYFPAAGGFVKTDKYWSRTTTKHINAFVGVAPCVVVPQADIERIARGEGK